MGVGNRKKMLTSLCLHPANNVAVVLGVAIATFHNVFCTCLRPLFLHSGTIKEVIVLQASFQSPGNKSAIIYPSRTDAEA